MLLIVGDFNYHVEDTSDSEACRFNNVIDSFRLTQHVADSTHRSGHTLYLMLSRLRDSLVLPTCSVDYGFPDHLSYDNNIHAVIFSCDNRLSHTCMINTPRRVCFSCKVNYKN